MPSGKLAFRSDEAHSLPIGALGLQHAVFPAVFRNDAERAAQDFRRGTVILHKPDHPQRRQIPRQLIKAAGLRAPEPVDRLVGIPDDKKTFPALVPGADQLILNPVDILEFIHQKVRESAFLFCPGAAPFLQGHQQQVVKVQDAVLLQAAAVKLVQAKREIRSFRLQAVFHPGNVL